jgi:hypothetical protein
MKILLSLFLINFSNVTATVPHQFEQNSITYKTTFNGCPSRSSGELAILIMKDFERTRSLRKIKERFNQERWEDKYFLSNYSVNYNPVSKSLKIHMECPKPLVRVQVYKENGSEHYSAIMVDSGKLVDPAYEMILRAEKLLVTELPTLAIPVRELEGEAHENFTRFAKQLNEQTRSKISEIIINENKELSIVFSLGHRSTSVYLGHDLWEVKLEKLIKIISYVEKSQKYPSSINLTNVKKVVVKF